METKLPISAYKERAKEQLLGHYSVATLSVFLIFAIVYGITMVLMIALMTYTIPASLNQSVALPNNSFKMFVIDEVIALVLSLITNLFTTGFVYVCMQISYGKKVSVGDTFYVFKHNPDKILILSFIMTVISVIFTLPSMLLQYMQPINESGRNFLIWSVCYVFGMVASIIVGLIFGMCYMIFLDDCERPVLECLSMSYKMMRGNKWRLFCLQLSFIGYIILGIFSVGIGYLWLVPYMNTSLVNFYRDLKGDFRSNTVIIEKESLSSEDRI